MTDLTVLITGASRGIGLATARRFADAGYAVYGLARKMSEIAGDRACFAKCIDFDLRRIDLIPRLAEDVGHVDILVNNAGIMHGIRFHEYPDDKREEMIRVNLEAPVALISAFADGMKRKSGGRIVNNASIAGEMGHPDVWYGITKAGVINFTKSFARILGPFGIVVNCVAAGPVETDMLKTIPQERQDAIKKSVYTGRFARPDEVAAAMFWLATECPAYINGTCIDINDGAFPR